jgi:hypothetical protein
MQPLALNVSCMSVLMRSTALPGRAVRDYRLLLAVDNLARLAGQQLRQQEVHTLGCGSCD